MQHLSSPLQIKAARSLLEWSQRDLAEKTMLSTPTINKAESSNNFNNINLATLAIIETVFLKNNIIFSTDNLGTIAVFLKPNSQPLT